MKVKLGNTYKDSISGFEGIAIARAVYLYGCQRVMVAPNKLKPDGDFLPDCWFDEAQLVSVRSKTKVAKRGKSNGPAGPSRSTPPSRDPV